MNVQIIGPPGAGKTTLLRHLSRCGFANRTGYRPARDLSILFKLIRDVISSGNRATLTSTVLKSIDQDAGSAGSTCIPYLRICSDLLMSQNCSLEEIYVLWKRLIYQVYIWERFHSSSEIGIYDDHFYQNILSFCALREPNANITTLLQNTPHPDVAIFLNRSPEDCLKNMMRRRRGPPRVLTGKSNAETLRILQLCQRVTGIVKDAASDYGVKVIYEHEEMCPKELAAWLNEANSS